jgi:SWI/SNF-related matrix-associated actin-dependent regulator of chromatin subfamily A member 5
MLDVIQNHMVLRGIGFARLDGQTSRPRRSLDIKLFQQKDSRASASGPHHELCANLQLRTAYRVFLISTRAGGLGINLTAATVRLPASSHWQLS